MILQQTMDWTTIITSALAGGGIWAVIKALVDKRKSPYDMLIEMMAEQKRYFQERYEEYEREKLDSAEKSAVLTATHKCQHRFADPSIICPVDEANEERLKNRCSRCKYGEEDENN